MLDNIINIIPPIIFQRGVNCPHFTKKKEEEEGGSERIIVIPEAQWWILLAGGIYNISVVGVIINLQTSLLITISPPKVYRICHDLFYPVLVWPQVYFRCFAPAMCWLLPYCNVCAKLSPPPLFNLLSSPPAPAIQNNFYTFLAEWQTHNHQSRSKLNEQLKVLTEEGSRKK